MLTQLLSAAKRIRRSDAFKDAVATPKRWAIARQQRANEGIFSIEIESISGFFAIMQTILFILLFCEKNKLYPDISAKGGIYGDATGTVDWFGALFDTIQMPDPSIASKLRTRSGFRTSRIRGVEELGFRTRFDRDLSLAKASALFNDHYRPSAAVMKDVDSVCEQLSISSSTLAVHYRGTDKVHEAGKVSPSLVCDAVEKISRTRSGFERILLASDDIAFIEYFQSHPFKLPVTVAPAVYMPKAGKAIHFSGHPGLAIGREALVTCLLLSRCGFLIKTPSYLSGWAKIFNPLLPVWLISPLLSRGLFPDRQLWMDQESGTVKYDETAAPLVT
jgi:hypothetical protein